MAFIALHPDDDDDDKNEFKVDDQLKTTEADLAKEKKEAAAKDKADKSTPAKKDDKKSTVTKKSNDIKNSDGTPLADNQVPDPNAKVDDTTVTKHEVIPKRTADAGSFPGLDASGSSDSSDTTTSSTTSVRVVLYLVR